MRTTALALLLIINNRRQTVHDCKAESTKFVLEDLPFDGIGFDSPRLQPNSVGRVKPPTIASSKELPRVYISFWKFLHPIILRRDRRRWRIRFDSPLNLLHASW